MVIYPCLIVFDALVALPGNVTRRTLGTVSGTLDLLSIRPGMNDMGLTVLQIVAVTLVVGYLGYLRISISRRKGQSWESLIARLQTGWSGRQLSEHFLYKEGVNSTPDDTWEHIGGMRGLWAIYKNAAVMLRMADYAARHGENVDPELLRTLRSDAVQIRLCTMMTIAQCAFSQASDGVRYNAFRAASMYTGMAARMTQLLEGSASVALPSFVAAM